jgi:hypothetical protein
MISNLVTTVTARSSGRPSRRPKGWTPERRARQSALIRRWQPWRRSTGPKSEAGKMRVAMNALRHGGRSRAWRLRTQRIRHAIRLCAQTVLIARALIRQRDRATLPMRHAGPTARQKHPLHR